MKIAKQLALPILLLVLLLFVSCDTTTPTGETTAETKFVADDSHEHTYSSATCTTPGTCVCGETYGEALGHDLTDATCTTPAVCNRCGVAEGSALGHDYHSATCTKPQICSRCQKETGEPLGHEFKDSTCTSPEICKRCELTQGEPLGHTYDSATCIKPENCSVCGYEHGEALGHNYDDQSICIRCNEVDPESLLKTAKVVDSDDYSVKSITDSFGKKYANAHVYEDPVNHEAAFSVHSLPKGFNTFEGKIVAVEGTSSKYTYTINIFVDNKLVYSLEDYISTSGAVDFSVNISNGATLKIEVWGEIANSSMSGDIAIVDAEFSK